MATKKKKKVDLTYRPRIVKEEVEETTIKIGESERELSQDEYEVRDITWAVGLKCACGYELDLFTWNEPVERKCKKCGRQYDIRLMAYEVGLKN